MIRRSRAQSSSLFLMELILAILFFSITSAVCVQFFVKSHLLSRESRVLSQAVNECSNIAEVFDASEGTGDAVSLLKANFPDISAELVAGETDAAVPAQSAGTDVAVSAQDTDADAAASAQSAGTDVAAPAQDTDADAAASAQDTDADATAPAQSAGALAVMYYDETFSPCRKETAVYTLTAALSEEGTMQTAKITVTDSDDSVIYELNTSHHNARRTDS